MAWLVAFAWAGAGGAQTPIAAAAAELDGRDGCRCDGSFPDAEPHKSNSLMTPFGDPPTFGGVLSSTAASGARGASGAGRPCGARDCRLKGVRRRLEAEEHPKDQICTNAQRAQRGKRWSRKTRNMNSMSNERSRRGRRVIAGKSRMRSCQE